MITRAPYPLTWDPTPAATGGATVVNRGRNDLGTRDFFLSSARNNPSSATLLTSFGVDAGHPQDSGWGHVSNGSQLVVQPIVSVLNTFFYTGGVFNSALTSAKIAIYVEEFDSRGNFRRGVTTRERSIERQNPWWFSGNATTNPSTFHETILQTDPVRVTLGNFYRVWVDVTAEISAAGYGGVGGSGAIAQATVRVEEIEVFFAPWS